MQNSFYESADRFFSQECSGSVIRSVEQGSADRAALWETMLSAGFADALVPESAEGAGLALVDIWPIVFCMGRHAVPLPYAHTLFARAWLNQAAKPIPEGTITFAPYQVQLSAGGLTARAVSFGFTADWVLVQHDDNVWLCPTAKAEVVRSGGYGSLDADLTWSTEVLKAAHLGRWNTPQFEHALALTLAVLIAGGTDRVFEMSLGHANQREQFGKPIGRFQALQQQISEMAELVFGARMAAEMACRSQSWAPIPMLAALAKAHTSQSVGKIVAVSHAVHGAIGVTHEYDLQLYTRRLNEWSRAGGGAAYWSQQLGKAILNSEQTTLDFCRTELFLEDVRA
jgi:alkylation response protein AidB-like acyl-CoA dehydrogenase